MDLNEKVKFTVNELLAIRAAIELAALNSNSGARMENNGLLQVMVCRAGEDDVTYDACVKTARDALGKVFAAVGHDVWTNW